MLPTFINYALAAALHFRYPLLFIGYIIEGPILTVAAGFLLHRGVLNPLFTFLALGSGDLAADIVWYYVGYFWVKPALTKHGKFLGLTSESFERIKSIFHRRSSVILFISKITMGFGMALGVLMTAGAIRIPMRSYLFYNSLGEIIYVTILMILGYYLSGFYGTISTGLHLISLLGVFLAIGLAFYGFSRYLRNKAQSL
jgi:membrane protein DedA with SNARE-associated domain